MLFDSIIYGPIHSRRLGVSLGINLMPVNHKICTFDCVYCECGFNQQCAHPVLPTYEEYMTALREGLQNLSVAPDVLTFSGNGEPTLHPDFLRIIQGTRELRDELCPTAKISVLSNSTQLGRQDVIQGLMLADNRILKLDSALDKTMRLIDQPVNKSLTVMQIKEGLGCFDGDFILQTCFLRGTYRGDTIDNTTPEELEAWYEAVRELHPKQVMIYVIDRATPVTSLEKLTLAEMKNIAAPLIEEGYDIQISA
ncbi:MAG: radical SAM protein [Paludibacteraceae bacterium]|nr:radical SAM protein [Paludibacteraceae bacterium]